MAEVLIKLEQDGIQVPILYRRHRGAKRLRITIKGATAMVTLPWRVSKAQALVFVEANQGWVFEQVNKHIESTRLKSFRQGQEILYLGQYRKAPDQDDLMNWYKQEAARLFSQKLSHFANRMGVSFNQFRVKDQKTRWGSCSSKGNINLNWRLIMAPEALVDYVIIHELAHLKYMNHSNQFWQLVEQYKPDYQTCRRWLTKEGKQLMLYI